MNINNIVNVLVEQRKISRLNLFDVSLRDEDDYMNALKASWVRTVQDVHNLLHNGGSILEIGSYYGVVALSLAKLNYKMTTFDVPEVQNNEKIKAIYLENQIHTASGYLQNIPSTSLPFAKNSFDCVIMCEVLEHLNFNPLSVLKEINRVIRPGGFFYLTVPQSNPSQESRKISFRIFSQKPN
jgi:2-polyprenyl-3-methyl-5-hydroxy-6-metoxy-1,4-benzoquinol methylase